MIRRTAATYLPPFKGQAHISAVLGVGTNSQLVKVILRDFPKAVEQTRRLAPRFNTGDIATTARNVWNFLKYQITYKEDSGTLQRIKLPSALVATGSGDCKSYSEFAAGIMANLGYKVTFRFAGYGGATIPGHVYITASNGRQTVIIDGVYSAFNAEKTPTSYLKDYTMQIETISGIGCQNCDNSIGATKLKKAVQKAKAQVKATAKQATAAVKKAAPGIVKKAAELTKKAAGMAPRTAFLQLVKLNVHSFAARLNRNRAKSLDRWKKIGGNPGELNASINAGLKRKPILGLEGIGVVGEGAAAVASILAAAAPVIAAMAALLGKEPKEAVIPPTTDKGDGTTPPAAPPTQEEARSNATDIIEGATKLLQTLRPQSQQNTQPTSASPQGGQDAGGADPAATTDSGNNNSTMLLIGGAALLFLLMKK